MKGDKRMAKKYEDDKIVVLKSDIERLRTRPEMYISFKGSEGAHHLCKEGINNGIDEALNPKSPCDLIDITYDGNTNRITIYDNGRGIPFNEVETICTILHSGSNFYKEEEADKNDTTDNPAGENGVGLTAINALSADLKFVIYREGKKGFFIFDDGKLVREDYYDAKPDVHGTMVTFIPSEEFLGPCDIDPVKLRNWVEEISYTLPQDKTIKLTIIENGSDIPKTEVFNHKNGLSDLMSTMVKEPMIKSIHLKHRYKDIPKTRTEVVFNIEANDTSDFGIVKSYANRCSTIDRGTHVEAAANAWCKAVTKMADEIMSDNERKKLNITYEDCRVGLCGVVLLDTPRPMFTGQTKQKVFNKPLFKPLMSAIYKDLMSYFRDNPAEAKKIVNIIKKSAKARQEVLKVKKSDYRAIDNDYDVELSKIFKPCSSKEYKELWILEGGSALGQFESARDYRFQAGFKLKGNPKNALGCSTAEILANPEFKALIRVLGAGVGKDFNIKKLKYDKIIIFVDSDIDGWNMNSLLSTFFLWVMPEVIISGKLYRAIAPLYLLKNKKNPYLISKVAYYDLFADIVSKNVSVSRVDGKSMTKAELKNMITANRDYIDELEQLARYYYTNHEIIEFAILHRGEKDFGKTLVKKFPELKYDAKENVISGIHNFAYQYLMLGETFNDRCKRMSKYIHDLNKGEIYYKVTSKDGEDVLQSLGTFFKNNKQYLPVIDTRIKGIGELDIRILWETTLNPKNRHMIRLTCSDLQAELETTNILHGKNPELRKSFMKDYIFSKDDLDT